MRSREQRKLGRLVVVAVVALTAAAPARAAAPAPDVEPPTISIVAPADGAHYGELTSVAADYTCTDPPALSSGLATCQGPVASGALIDTLTPGEHAFTVDATDNAQNAATRTVHYTVDARTPPPPPSPTVGLNSQLLARTASAGPPDAPATDPALSHDGRVDRFAAYVSAATNIVAGSGSHRNVFLVARSQPWGQTGTPWTIGATSLVSRGRGGPADGDSWGPALSGSDAVGPSCLAFVSQATNLVAGDTDGRADAFVRSLSSGRLTRIAGRGAVSAVAVDARCKTIAYVAGGALYTRAGKKTKRVATGGITRPQISYDGKTLVFEKAGGVYSWRVGARARKLGAGSSPTTDGFGRYVAFTRGGQVLQADIGGGGTHAIGSGIAPAMTSGGHFVFYATGSEVRLNVKSKPVATCPTGNVVQTASSPHGNYVVFTCSNGGAYLGYVGGQ